jgi:phosphate transport system permease protein
VFHHVLPLAMPGVMTGAIISMAHALGETAPLLLIGMVSFVPGVPAAVTDSSSALPVLVFIWENASERAFHERTAAAIIVLLVFMIVMNAAAILLRRRFERRW